MGSKWVVGMTRPFGQSMLDRLHERALDVAAGRARPDDALEPTSSQDVWDLLKALFRFSVDGVAISHRESQIFVEVSNSLCALTGYRRSELLGRTPQELRLLTTDDVSALARHNAANGMAGLYEGELLSKSGRRHNIEFSQQLLGPEYLVTIIRDVTKRRHMEADFRRLAATDSLTGLLNRRRFAEEVSRVIGESERFGEAVTLLVIDLDGLKLINDQYGHHAGDAALRTLAEALQRHTRETDIAGRLGGDEFAVLVTRGGDQGAKRIIQSLLTDLEGLDVRVEGGRQLRVSASAGAVTAYPPLEFDSLLAEADRAMYRVKNRREDPLAGD